MKQSLSNVTLSNGNTPLINKHLHPSQSPSHFTNNTINPLYSFTTTTTTTNNNNTITNQPQVQVYKQQQIPPVPIPAPNFKYFNPQASYNAYNDPNHPQTSQQQINININMTLPSYPYHKNRAVISKKYDPSSMTPPNKVYYTKQPSVTYNPSSDRMSSSSSSTTISSNSSHEHVSMLKSASSSMFTSYDSIADHAMSNPCTGSPKNRCNSPSCTEYDPMLQKPKPLPHNKSYQKLYKKPPQNQYSKYVYPANEQSFPSPYAKRKPAENKRYSNGYEYKLNHFDLNSIHEDSPNET